MNIDYEKVWMSIPLPSIVLNEDDIVVEVNPPGEGFLNASNKSLKNRSIWELINIGASLEESYKKVKKFNSPLFVTDVKVGANGREPIPCNIQIAPIIGLDGSTILLIAPREIAGRISQSKSVKAAAKSAIGMAEMLAHEIKNPLAGITGAAQLLSMGLSTAALERLLLLGLKGLRLHPISKRTSSASTLPFRTAQCTGVPKLHERKNTTTD